MANQMGTMSSRWLPAMEAPELVVVSYAEIWSGIGGTKIAGPLEATAGTVSIDRANAIRRSATNVTFLSDPAGVLLPITGGGGALYPSGAELALFKGCRYTDGTTEVAALGRFLLEKTEVNDDGSGVTIITNLKDRGQTITRAKFTAPYATDGTSTADVAIAAILDQQVPGLTLSFTPTAMVPPISTWKVNDDPWAACLSLAAGASMELFPDQNGVIILQPIQDPASIAVCATYADGTPAAPTALKRVLDISAVPNVVCVQSSGSGVSPPIQTFWWDNNSASVTFYATGTPGATLPTRDPASTYPTLVTTITTSLADNFPDAQAIANAAGLGFIGTIEGAIITIRDNPAHDVNDVVATIRPPAGIPALTSYITDQVQIDLGTQTPLVLTTRIVV